MTSRKLYRMTQKCRRMSSIQGFFHENGRIQYDSGIEATSLKILEN